jgi:hypothetical protein
MSTRRRAEATFEPTLDRLIFVVAPTKNHWPDRCPDCGTAMEFAFTPVVHRLCSNAACARQVTEAEVRGS